MGAILKLGMERHVASHLWPLAGCHDRFWARARPSGDAARRRDGVTAPILSQGLPNPLKIILDGRFWTCEDITLTAPASSAAASQPIVYECQHAAELFGVIKSYQTGGTLLKDAQLAKCNRSATRTPITRQPSCPTTHNEAQSTRVAS